MTTQVNLFTLAEDMRLILLASEEEGARAFPIIAPIDDTPNPSMPSQYADTLTGDSFVLLPATLSVVEIFYTQLRNEAAHGQVDDFNSPVIVVKSSRLEQGAISNGRIFLGNDPTDPRHAPVKKLFNQLSKIIKKWEKTKFNIFVGPETARQVRSGKLTLKHHALTLELP